MAKTVNLKINGKNYVVESGQTILDVCNKLGIYIPTLCFMKGISEGGHCGLCVVEVKGARTLLRACITEVFEGMEVITDSPFVRDVRKTVFEMILADHKVECPVCKRDETCEIKKVAKYMGLPEFDFPELCEIEFKDNSIISREPAKCIKCKRCISTCQLIPGIGIYGFVGKGHEATVEPPESVSMDETPCIVCGQCVVRCPVGALTERDDIDKVLEVLADEKKTVFVSFAPSVRVAIGEAFGMEPGTVVVGKLVSALRKLGFDRVYDVNFGADLTIVEEANELIERIKGDKPLPMATSCCPGWVNFVERFYPEFIPYLSTCKSPQAMLGALVKAYMVEKEGISKENIVHVTVMPCTAKKYEAARDELAGDTDIVLTTRELGRLLKMFNIDIRDLPEDEADKPFGEYTGAGTIFGVTGGVMEAALRTAADWLSGGSFDKIEFESVRGFEDLKFADVEVGDKKIKVAVAHTLSAAVRLLEMIKNKEVDIHFFEVMACPGGCIGGGGQPIPTTKDILRKRAEGLYSDDEKRILRKSHENPYIKAAYEMFLGEIGGEKAHKLLHTTYSRRPCWEAVFLKK
ncbi:NADH-dependent [FeFe] hydrogenase, group A6 [Desulfurobacterium atlanticum]|uniref:NAD(P)-dependent iron-only hydrogenase catalytic subunit n=1 Tax=Desulfurobacterium atlanticum TaxID=240169 RepID=A0A238YVP3_9BACT|nr:NADH-dependent [FeFe] hydrogenase, group A6 [Desulfurobacterium atlanticum]SNR74801.1 NAD(P)-dependent iron-only hydrogenase catalytic subunit [Desulfurobacterium atlanticum]